VGAVGVGVGVGGEVDNGDDRVFEHVALFDHVEGVGTDAPGVESRALGRG
jgi:hypothetical protein